MAESRIEVKLVRCPKCKNLLPEPRDCSFFQCGGCGTVLCAKNKDREADPVLEEKSVKNKAKETEVNSVSSESDSSSRHQQTGQTETWDDITGSESGLDRSRKTEGFRFSAPNYFTQSISSDEAIQQDRAELVRKLDQLKAHHLLQPNEQQLSTSSSRLKKAPPLRFPSSGKHLAGPYYHQTNQQQSHHHYSRQYTGTNVHDLFNTHQRNERMMLHQSTCSCFHCYDPYHRASGSVYPPSGLPDALHNIGFYSYERSSTAFRSSPLHSPRAFIPPHAPPASQSRGPNELVDALKNALSRVRLSKAVSSSGGSRLIHPVAGGAPFINCRKCSKILKLPGKTTRKQQRLRCGACSCLIDFYFADNKLILSTDTASAREEEEEEAHSRLHWITALDVSSDAMDRGLDYVSSTGPASISDKAHDYSTSPSLSEDELCSDSPTTGRKLIPDYDYSSINVRDRSGPRSQSSRSEQNRVSLGKTVKRQNSMREEASVLIEMDVNDYSHNNGVSQDSADDCREEIRKGGFGSMVKNSFKDLKKSMQNEVGSDVLVNGHLVAERLVKMAEKQAGPIRPGNYWYDYRAGFWGIMGGQCLGILPPFIEELNYPMPEKCAGGTTGVFVNGRELHQKDLRLLIARGLPRDRERSYTVYITGRVIDEDTGEELNSLGKLAPTVDKLKRGFGMRVPRRYA